MKRVDDMRRGKRKRKRIVQKRERDKRALVRARSR